MTDGARLSAQPTRCCIVGAGPGGVMLALLLARAGVPVTLIEAHKDFDRDFRGDTIHPSTLEVLDQIGLAETLLALPHTKTPDFRFRTPTSDDALAVFSRLPTKFPYMVLMPQSRFLEFVVGEAKRYPHFTLVMGANAHELIEEDGAVRGVRLRGAVDGEVRATLTIAADGRFSRLRKLAGLTPVPTSEPMEIVWFRVPRRIEDGDRGAGINVGRREAFVLLERADDWQVGSIGPAGRYRQIKEEGLDAFHRSLAEALPWLGERAATVKDWSETHLLSVEGSRLATWWKPGLLLIGDAAHVMLPVGGVGINCAIADAVEAANVLAEPLRAGRADEANLAEVQRRREGVTRTIQTFQTRISGGLLSDLKAGRAPRMPLPVKIILKIPGLRNLPARVAAFGVRRVRLERVEETAP